MFPNECIAEAVSLLRGVPKEELSRGIDPKLPLVASLDALDRVELMAELEEEFDRETIRWALRYVEALCDRFEARRLNAQLSPPPGGPNPLWDRDLDG